MGHGSLPFRTEPRADVPLEQMTSDLLDALSVALPGHVRCIIITVDLSEEGAPVAMGSTIEPLEALPVLQTLIDRIRGHQS